MLEVKGTSDVQRVYDTLALIISQKNNVHVTVKVTQLPKDTQARKESA